MTMSTTKVAQNEAWKPNDDAPNKATAAVAPQHAVNRMPASVPRHARHIPARQSMTLWSEGIRNQRHTRKADANAVAPPTTTLSITSELLNCMPVPAAAARAKNRVMAATPGCEPLAPPATRAHSKTTISLLYGVSPRK